MGWFQTRTPLVVFQHYIEVLVRTVRPKNEGAWGVTNEYLKRKEGQMILPEFYR